MTSFVQRIGAEVAGRVQTGNIAAHLATISICHQSVRLLIEQSKDSGINHSMLDAFDHLFEQAVDGGYGDVDLAIPNNFMHARERVSEEATA